MSDIDDNDIDQDYDSNEYFSDIESSESSSSDSDSDSDKESKSGDSVNSDVYYGEETNDLSNSSATIYNSPLMTKYEYSELITNYAELLIQYPQMASLTSFVSDDVIEMARHVVLNRADLLPFWVERRLDDKRYVRIAPADLIPPPRHHEYALIQ